MSYEDINTFKGCGGQRWHCKWLLQQITPRRCILKKQSNRWLFQVARNKQNGTSWCWQAMVSVSPLVTDPWCLPRAELPGSYGSVRQQNSTQLPVAWAPVSGLIPSGSCVLSFPYTHTMLVTACLAKLLALVLAMSCPWWQKGPAQLSIPAPDGNRLTPAAFSPVLYSF